MYEYNIEEWSSLQFNVGTDVFYFAVSHWNTTLMQATERYSMPLEIGNAVRVRREGNAFEVECNDGDRNRVYGWAADRWSVNVITPTPATEEWEDEQLSRYQDVLAGSSTGCDACDEGRHGMITGEGKCQCCGIALSYYVVMRTLAPESYDYDYTVQVGEEFGLRLVAIPSGVLQYQTDRYLSGMYTAQRMGVCYNAEDWAASGDMTSPF